jgi:hypothetical protein
VTPAQTDDALNRLAKWRSVYTGRILGTRVMDPQTVGFRDLFEKLLLLRAETTALTRILLEKGIVGQDELTSIIGEEADFLNVALEQVFPGISANLSGITYKMPEAAETMKGWPK